MNNIIIKDEGKPYIVDNKGQLYVRKEMGINTDTGKKNFIYEKENVKWLIPGKVFLRNGEQYSLDHNIITHLLINKNKFTVAVENNFDLEKTVWTSVILRPNEYMIFTHKYYTLWVERVGNTKENGTPINMLQVYDRKEFLKYRSLKRGEIIV